MESAKLAEAEIREAIKKLKSEQEEIELLASKATLKLKEANTQLQHLQASSLTATGSIKELSRVDKFNSAFEEAMNISSKPKPKSSNSTVITLEDEDEEQQVSFNSQKFRIKMDSTLTTFRGRPDENINDWLYTLDRAFRTGCYTSDEKLMIGTNYLKDIAIQDYIVRERLHGKESYTEFCQYMRKQYTPTNQNMLIREKLKALKQMTDVKDYYIEFRKLALQSATMTDEERMSLFLSGLKPSLSSWCGLMKVKTLDECYNAALDKEKFGEENHEKYTAGIYYGTNQRSANSNSNNLPLQTKSAQFARVTTNNNLQSRYNNNQNKSSGFKQESLPLKMAKPKQEHSNEICCICNIRGHIGENCKRHLNVINVK